MNYLIKRAFTLAEVLIVIAIIGIVASLTIPTIINKVQKQEYVVGLKKAYSTQMDGWTRLLAEENVNYLEDTTIFSKISATSCDILNANTENCKPFFDSLKKYFRFNVITAENYKSYKLNGEFNEDYSNKTGLAFADGSIIFRGQFSAKPTAPTAEKAKLITDGGGHLYSIQGWFWIDINGFKKPNIVGRDIFAFR